MDGFGFHLNDLAIGLEERADHMFTSRHFNDNHPGGALLRTVSPTSCPPGVTPAGDETYDMPLSALRPGRLPSINTAETVRPPVWTPWG